MSILLHSLRRLLAAFATPAPAAPDLDTLSVQDWADLPPHHPLCE